MEKMLNRNYDDCWIQVDTFLIKTICMIVLILYQDL